MNITLIRRLALLMVIILAVSLVLPACKSTEDMIVGYWENTEGGQFRYLEFFSDGSYTSSHVNYEGSYSIEGNRLKLTGILVESKTYSFEIKGNTLYLYNRSGDLLATFVRS